MKDVTKMSDDDLFNDFMFRIYRNEGKLQGKDREYFQSLCDELAKRGVIDRNDATLKVKEWINRHQR